MKNPGIYILTSPSGKQYVGRDVNLPSRVKIHLSGKDTSECPAIHMLSRNMGMIPFLLKSSDTPAFRMKLWMQWNVGKLGNFKRLLPKDTT